MAVVCSQRMGSLGTDSYTSSVTQRLKRNKRNQGNFLSNHSRPDPANIYYGALVGLFPRAGRHRSHWGVRSALHILHGPREIRGGLLTCRRFPRVSKHVPAQGTECCQHCPLPLARIHLNIYMDFAPIVTRMLRCYVSHKRADVYFTVTPLILIACPRIRAVPLREEGRAACGKHHTSS